MRIATFQWEDSFCVRFINLNVFFKVAVIILNHSRSIIVDRVQR